MIRREEDGLKFYQSAILLEIGFRNYFFTRFGGESEGEFAELNLSFRVGDKPERVKKNREKVRRVIGGEKLITVKQVHSGTVLDLDQKEIAPETLLNTEADGIVTERSGVAIGVLCADCFPLLLADKEKRIIGICHCGRRGILENVIENTLEVMVRKGGNLGKVMAVVGPGICERCYQVDEGVIAEFRKKFPEGEGKLWKFGRKGYQLNLKGAIISVLRQQGIGPSQIEDLGLCTYEEEDFFSHRRSQGKTGRQLSVIMIE